MSMLLRQTRPSAQTVPALRSNPAPRPSSRGYLRATVPTDPARTLVDAIVALVPAASWGFARIDPNGALTERLCSVGHERELERLGEELRGRREQQPTGPCLGETLGSRDDDLRGVTLVFADARTDYGVLTVLRTPEDAPFTSAERCMLRFALDAGSEILSALRLQPEAAWWGPRSDAARIAPGEGAFYVLDAQLRVVLTPTVEGRPEAVHGQVPPSSRLPALVEKTVRELTADWQRGGILRPGAARPVPFLIVRTQPLWGPAGSFIGVHVERDRSPNSLGAAAARFRISPREQQVLALVLDGNHLDEIAKHLDIAPSTVQDHIKNMLHKTHSANRSELIARMLGWESPPRAPRAHAGPGRLDPRSH